MNYRRKERWTANQTKFLQDNYSKMTDEQIAETLGRTLKSVRLKRLRIDLEKRGAGRGIFKKA